ncbi:unnamed protein product [Trichobilharzia regenti]|nr:unnamed protein product [Trichobilharzia regenti]
MFLSSLIYKTIDDAEKTLSSEFLPGSSTVPPNTTQATQYSFSSESQNTMLDEFVPTDDKDNEPEQVIQLEDLDNDNNDSVSTSEEHSSLDIVKEDQDDVMTPYENVNDDMEVEVQYTKDNPTEDTVTTNVDVSYCMCIRLLDSVSFGFWKKYLW